MPPLSLVHLDPRMSSSWCPRPQPACPSVVARSCPPVHGLVRLAVAGEHHQGVAVVVAATVLALGVGRSSRGCWCPPPAGVSDTSAVMPVVRARRHGLERRRTRRRRARRRRLGRASVVTSGLERRPRPGPRRRPRRRHRASTQHGLAALLTPYDAPPGRAAPSRAVVRQGRASRPARRARAPSRPGQSGQLGDGAAAGLAPGQVPLELQAVRRRQRAEDVGRVGVREGAVAHAVTPISSRASRRARRA